MTAFGAKRDFVLWLRVQHNRGDAVGDLARELTRNDRTAPRRGGPLAVRRYLAHQGACSRVRAALEQAISEWREQLA